MIIDYSREDFVDKVRNVDLVLDLVGGETQKRSFQVLKSGGTLVSAVSPPDQSLAVKKNVKALFFLVDVTSNHLAQIGSLINGGSLTTRLGPVYTLNDVVEIHEILDGLRPRPKGKMVINIM
jgi:NADPH:quinone reductase-like Zn-dependent oxidoreductase